MYNYIAEHISTFILLKMDDVFHRKCGMKKEKVQRTNNNKFSTADFIIFFSSFFIVCFCAFFSVEFFMPELFMLQWHKRFVCGEKTLCVCLSRDVFANIFIKFIKYYMWVYKLKLYIISCYIAHSIAIS